MERINCAKFLLVVQLIAIAHLVQKPQIVGSVYVAIGIHYAHSLRDFKTLLTPKVYPQN